MKDDVVFTRMKSALGELVLVGDATGDEVSVRAIWFADKPHAKLPAGAREDAATLAPVKRQIEEYLSGSRRAFSIRLAPTGTPFQRDVWRALAAIPYGQTVTYSDIAAAIGRPAAVRAVGAANGKNPISIVVPCHRVIGADGALTGYVGGIENKLTLLALEGGVRV